MREDEFLGMCKYRQKQENREKSAHAVLALATQIVPQVQKAYSIHWPSARLVSDPRSALERNSYAPSVTARVTVEESSTLGWSHYAGPTGVILGMHTFGMSAPIKAVAEHFGFTVDRVVAAARQTMGQTRAA